MLQPQWFSVLWNLKLILNSRSFPFVVSFVYNNIPLDLRMAGIFHHTALSLCATFPDFHLKYGYLVPALCLYCSVLSSVLLYLSEVFSLIHLLIFFCYHPLSAWALSEQWSFLLYPSFYLQVGVNSRHSTCLCCLTECCHLHAPELARLTSTSPSSLGSDVTSLRKSPEHDNLGSYCLSAPEALVVTPILAFITTCCDDHIIVSVSPHCWREELWLTLYLNISSFVHCRQPLNNCWRNRCFNQSLRFGFPLHHTSLCVGSSQNSYNGHWHIDQAFQLFGTLIGFGSPWEVEGQGPDPWGSA